MPWWFEQRGEAVNGGEREEEEEVDPSAPPLTELKRSVRVFVPGEPLLLLSARCTVKS